MGGAWVILPQPPPCYVTEYNSDDVHSKVIAPSWRGKVQIAIDSSTHGKESPLFGSNLYYSAPSIASIGPAAPDAAGMSDIELTGLNFGTHRDVVVDRLAAYAQQQAAAQAAADQQMRPLGLEVTVKRYVAFDDRLLVERKASDIIFRYSISDPTNSSASANPPARMCQFVNASLHLWSDRRIVCRAPRGIPGSDNVVSVQQFTVEDAERYRSPDVSLQYRRASVLAARPVNGSAPAAGGYSVTLTGALYALQCPVGAAKCRQATGGTGQGGGDSGGGGTDTTGGGGGGEPSASATPSASASASTAASASPSASTTGTISATASLSPTSSASTSRLVSSSGSGTASLTASPSATLSSGASASGTASGSSTGSGTSSPSPSPSFVPTPYQGYDGTWKVAVLVKAASTLGRVAGTSEAVVTSIAYSSDTALTFAMPQALGRVNISLQYSRVTDKGVTIAITQESAPFSFAVDPPFITDIAMEQPAQDPCVLLRSRAAYEPCAEVTRYDSPFQTQNLTGALSACYVNWTAPAAYRLPPYPAACSGAVSYTLNATSGGLSVDVTDGYDGDKTLCSGVAVAWNNGVATCSIGAIGNTPTTAASSVCSVRQDDGSGVYRINITSAAGQLACQVAISPLNVSLCTATAGIIDATSVRSVVSAINRPWGRRQALGSCYVDSIRGWQRADVLTRCIGFTQSHLLSRLPGTTVAVAANTDDSEAVSACELVDTVLDGKVGLYADIAGKVAEVDADLRAIRSSTYCWPRFPLNSSLDARYARCTKANTGSRSISIYGRNWGDKDIAVDAYIGGTKCKRASVESDEKVVCELETASGSDLPIGDLSAVVIGAGKRNSEGIPFPFYYNISSDGRQRSSVWGSPQARVTIRSVCRLGTRYSNATGGCVDCADDYNAACIGGDGLDFFQPRAVAKYWRTVPSEWQARHLDVSVIHPADYVRCAVPDLCLSNQVCVIGSDGWMCVQCAKGWARGIDGQCSDCSIDLAGSEAGIILGIFILLTSAICIIAYRSFPAVQTRVDKVQKRLTKICCSCCGSRKKKEGKPDAKAKKALADEPPKPKQPKLAIYIKVFFGFAQTLSAINALLASSKVTAKTTEVQPDDQQIVPNALNAVSVVGDLGLSVRQVVCVLSKWTNDAKRRANLPDTTLTEAKAQVLMWLPLVVLVVVLTTLGMRWVVVNATGRLCARDKPLSGSAEARQTKKQSAAAPEQVDDDYEEEAGSVVVDNASPEEKGKKQDNLSYYSVLIFYATLSPSIAAMARLQSCATQASGGYLLDDPAISCYDPAFQQLQQRARVFGAFYLILPLFIGLSLSLPFSPKVVEKWLSPMEFLYEAYKVPAEYVEAAYWKKHSFVGRLRRAKFLLHLPLGWEAFALFRKGLLMAVASG